MILTARRHWSSGALDFGAFVYARLMTSQFKDIVTHTKKMKTVKCKSCGVWVQIFVWNFQGAFEISPKILNPYTAKYAFYEMSIK